MSADEAVEPVRANLPVAVGPVLRPRSFREERRHPASAFATQLIGQDGERRGLRGGASVLLAAQTAYNRIQWSGARDRRAPKGVLNLTVV